ncbi:hypothetical protein LAZ67_6001288 [Cordylochernes scorpioides]|uniref:Metalloendopeptidase n=1 Tax=Cordylochernes scorpioides TaxID=51811 RepID=A0ABY6KMS8_9ARAC|nr:hypothetical protein LAZ67_6001288 [Cordylochernes scorpioides]
MIKTSKKWYLVNGLKDMSYINNIILKMIRTSKKGFKDRSYTTDDKNMKKMLHAGYNRCHSSLGRDGGRQIVSLDEGCESFGTILHELNHAVGFDHEHSRSDRDDYIEILWDNIKEGGKEYFEKLEPHDNRLLTPFDFDSIMLYGPRDYSKNDCPTIRAKSGITIIDIDDKTVLSKGDIERINKLYEC